MSSGFSSDVVIKFVTQEQTCMLSFFRSFDGQHRDFALSRPQERATMLKKNLPILLDPLRGHIGVKQLKLDESQILRAVQHLDRFAWGFLDVLFGSGPKAAEFMAQLSQFLLPVFESASKDSRAPVVEIRASVTDDLAWILPFEFLPLAPEPTSPPLCPRNRFERFLGLRAEIVRFLRGGPDEIDTDASGRVSVHLFAYAGEDTPPGITTQLAFLGRETTVKSVWPSTPVIDAFSGASQLAQRLIALPAVSHEGTIQCIAHFSCHFHPAGPDGQGGYWHKSGFDFGKCADGKSDLTFSVFDLRGEVASQQAQGTQTDFGALYFLNACQTAATGIDEDTMLAFLQSRNAAAVIGSETILPDRLAAEFAIRFYTELLRQVPLSKAVLKARRKLIERFSNPAGLFYTSYGNPILHVAGTKG
jgi:hypothetical protein